MLLDECEVKRLVTGKSGKKYLTQSFGVDSLTLSDIKKWKNIFFLSLIEQGYNVQKTVKTLLLKQHYTRSFCKNDVMGIPYLALSYRKMQLVLFPNYFDKEDFKANDHWHGIM